MTGKRNKQWLSWGSGKSRVCRKNRLCEMMSPDPRVCDLVRQTVAYVFRKIWSWDTDGMSSAPAMVTDTGGVAGITQDVQNI